MKDNATGSLDRRDFVIASLATVGASAAFATAAGGSDAQDKAASPRPTGTVYTGDLIGGKKVISALDVEDLATLAPCAKWPAEVSGRNDICPPSDPFGVSVHRSARSTPIWLPS